MGSLIVAGYDLLDPASPVQLTDESPSLGDGVPDTKTVARLLLDGDVIVGSRTGNRRVHLPVVIDGGTYAGRVAIFNDLARAVGQAQWSLSWTPGDVDGLLPTVVLDCFRGTADRDWSLLLANPDSMSVVLEFEAGPFTRSDTAVVSSPATAPTPLALHPFSTSTPALVSSSSWRNPAVNAVGGIGAIDMLPGAVGAATTLGGKPARQVSSFLAAESPPGMGPQFVPTIGSTLSPTVDLSPYQRILFSHTNPVALTAQPMLDPAWFPAGEQDLAVNASGGYWALQFTDSGGKRALARIAGSLAAGSFDVAIPIDSGVLTESGFDWTKVAAWRLRFYAGQASTSPGSGTTLELLPYMGASWVVTGGSVSGNSITASNGTEAQRSTAVAVTAGQAYSGTVDIAQSTGATANVQVGIEWYASGSVLLSTTWGAVVDLSQRVEVTGTAPATAVSAKIRVKFGPVGPSSTATFTVLPHMNAGSTPWRFKWPDYPGGSDLLTVTVSQPVAQPAPALGSGSTYTSSTWPSIKGAARSPAGVNVDCGPTKSAKRVLLMRGTSRAGFTPYLDTPASGPATTTDTTALSGKYRLLPAGTTGAPVYQLPATGYSGSYAIMARVWRTSATAVDLTAATWVDADTTVQQTVRSFAASDTALGTAAWQLLTIGTLTLPPKGVDPSNTLSKINLRLSASVASLIRLDMVVLVPLDGESLFVDSPVAYRYWWLTVPTSTDRAGYMIAGNNADKSDAVSVTAYQSGQAVIHFQPGDNVLALLLDQAGTDAAATVTYYPRWPAEAEAG